MYSMGPRASSPSSQVCVSPSGDPGCLSSLTLPFQQRFDRLDDSMRAIYIATVGFSLAATIALVAPVATHRLLFRQRRLKELVSASHRLAIAGLGLLGLALVGVTIVVTDMVYGRYAALGGGGIVLAAFVVIWLVIPLLLRARRRSGDDVAAADESGCGDGP
jgi:Family of unknown function (DUF6328)